MKTSPYSCYQPSCSSSIIASKNSAVRLLKCPYCHLHIASSSKFRLHLYGSWDFDNLAPPKCSKIRQVFPNGIPPEIYDNVLRAVQIERKLKSSFFNSQTKAHRQTSLIHRRLVKKAKRKLSVVDVCKNDEPGNISVELDPKNKELIDQEECGICRQQVRSSTMLLLPCCNRQRTCLWCIVDCCSGQNKQQLKCNVCEYSIVIPTPLPN